MVVGRINYQGKSQRQGTINSSVSARNLRKSDLGAVIFGCKNHTITECKAKQLFGLPYPHFSYVKNVTPGLPLFLFNYSDRMLHGIYEAASPGQLNVDPYAWTVDGEDCTLYPSQVRTRVREQCHALQEELFRPIIADNYYQQSLFWFELDHSQTRKLIELFLSPPCSNFAPPLHNTLLEDTRNSNGKGPIDVTETAFDKQRKMDMGQVGWDSPDDKMNWPALGDSNNCLPQRSWSSLFKESAASDTAKKGNLKTALNKQALTSWPVVDCPYMESQSTCFTTIPESRDQHLDTCAATGDMEECEKQAKDDEHCEAPQDFEGSMGSWDLEEYEAPMDPNLRFIDSSVLAKTTSSLLSNAFDKGLEIMDPREESGHPASVASGLHFHQSHELKRERERSFTTNVSDRRGEASEVSMINDEKEISKDADNHEASFAKEIELSVPLTIGEFRSSDIQPLVAKLIEEIGEMKGLQLEQNKKINHLETKLVESNLEVQQMRNQLNMLHYKKTSPSSGHFQGIDIESFNSFPEIDDSILIVGGYSGSSWLSDLSLYSPSIDVIRSLTSMTFLRYYTSIAKLNDEVFLCGGVRADVWYDTVESYNPRSNKWTTRPPLSKKKGSSAGISVLEKLFAIGGGDGVECFAEVEILELNFGKWIHTLPMKQKRFAPAAADINGTLYVVGGYDGLEYLKSVERFDPREHKWTEMASMKTRRGCHSLVVLNEKLYALGGYDGERMVSTVEVFDPRTCSWMTGESMQISRGYSGAAVIGETIFVIGGVNDNDEILASFECYEEGCGWRSSNSIAVGKRCFFSALEF